MNLDQYIKKTPNFPKPGILFYDLAPVLLNPEVWRYTIETIGKYTQDLQPTLVAGIESRGFLVSSALSIYMNLGSFLIRKKGKTPGTSVIGYTYDLEYGTDTLELNQAIVPKGSRVLILDDVLATGGTAQASVKLIEKAGCTAVGFISILELCQLKGRSKLNIPTISLLKVE